MRQTLAGLQKIPAMAQRAFQLAPWIRTFKVRRPLRFLRDYLLIERSMLFDPAYYYHGK